MNLVEILHEWGNLFREMRADRAQLRVFALQERSVETDTELIDPVGEEFEVVEVLRHLLKLVNQIGYGRLLIWICFAGLKGIIKDFLYGLSTTSDKGAFTFCWDRAIVCLQMF